MEEVNINNKIQELYAVCWYSAWCLSQPSLRLHLFILWGLRKDGMITNILIKNKHGSPRWLHWRSTFTGLHSSEQVITFKPWQKLPCAILPHKPWCVRSEKLLLILLWSNWNRSTSSHAAFFGLFSTCSHSQ